MYPRIAHVKHLGDYKLRLTFRNGEVGVIDLADRIIGRQGIYKPLQDTSFFAQVKVDPELGALVWPNDADFDPDVIYERTMLPKEKWKLQLAA